MATFYGIKEYAKAMKARAYEFKKGKQKGPITAAKYMENELRKTAPIDSGNVASTIHRVKNSVSVSGSNPFNQFPYIHWINATPGSGLNRVRLVWPYGDGTAVSFAQVANNKQSYRFYFKSLIKSQRVYHNAMVEALDKSLNATF